MKLKIVFSMLLGSLFSFQALAVPSFSIVPRDLKSAPWHSYGLYSQDAPKQGRTPAAKRINPWRAHSLQLSKKAEKPWGGWVSRNIAPDLRPGYLSGNQLPRSLYPYPWFSIEP